MEDNVTGLFRKNDSLDSTLRNAMAKEGCGLFERLVVSMRVRRLSSEGRAELEKSLTEMMVATGAILPTGDHIVGGVFVGNWQDFFQWFLDNLPAILEMIMTIIAIF